LRTNARAKKETIMTTTVCPKCGGRMVLVEDPDVYGQYNWECDDCDLELGEEEA